MIDRISRNFVHYSAYRQRMTSTENMVENYEQRQNISSMDADAKARMNHEYPRKTLELSLIRAAEESERIHLSYSYTALGQISPSVEAQQDMLTGVYVDLLA